MRRHVLIAAVSLAALVACAEAPANDADGAANAQAAPGADMENSVEGAPVIEPAVAADLERQISAIYDDWTALDIRQPPFAVTPRLEALFAAERAYVEADGAPRYLDFAWHVGGQDAEITGLEVSHEPVEPGMVVVTARFANFGEPRQVHYVWKQAEDDSWAVDDVTLESPELTMSLGSQLSGGAPY